ncbi:MAG: enoyl-CoA hydratase family protein [Mesorhizobium sp.]|uniref:enoyl-CoA hydratase family protein n=2 Tax=Mesorhizobium sp. TaxID=1871066 RepID=UPI000FE88487|nr:enoyl-CoA hydratase family protein [Mesorhizobium sp.]RWP88564.1 MAG: enoyl-CoA hydratase family protein [Mesorhizobium sp.]
MVAGPLPAPSGPGKDRLRLWIRLLRASRTIEAELRERLKKEFNTTLPRFDVMAALYRAPEGMLMSDLSRFLLVSNGNVTGIVDRLVSEGLVVHDIIGPLVNMDMKQLLAFTRMTGDFVKAMLNCGKPIIAAVDGVAVGAGAIIAMSSDIRIATPEAKTAFLFTRVGLAGCDMGACAILPRIIGQGRAAELLYTGRTMTAAEGERWGFYNRLVDAASLEADALDMAARIVSGPTFAHGITKTQLNQEWSMGLDQAIEAEAQAQAICMQTRDFERAYKAFVAKEKPVFEGD